MRGARPGRDLARRFARGATWAPDADVVVALSGGADSVALATLATEYARTPVRVILAHVAHGVRASGAQDEAVARAVASRLETRFVVRRLRPPNAAEATLRALRYDALVDVARESGAGVVLTGHHAADQTETVLLQLFRGTAQATLGMASARELAPGVALVRPLLEIAPEELRRHAERRGLPYAIDPTNAVPRYARNAVRAALGGLRAHFPGLDAAVARFAGRRARLATGDAATALADLAYVELQRAGLAEEIDAERLGAIARVIELRGGRRVHVGFSGPASRSGPADAVRSVLHMQAASSAAASIEPVPPLEPPLVHIVYDAAQIAAAVRRLAVELLCGTPYSGELVLLMVLEGARRFAEDLHAVLVALPQAKHRRIELAEIGVSSYAGALRSSGVARITRPLEADLRNKHVIIVDDILDQGHTLRMLAAHCATTGARSVKSCVLFDKRDVAREFVPDFAGLEVPPVFVVGYGLDYQENFRTLPYLAALDPAALPRQIPTDAHASGG